MDVNVKGLFNFLGEVFKPSPLQEPASMYSKRGFAKGSVYSASKHAVIGMVTGAAIKVGRRGIRVNSVMLVPIDTSMLRGTAPVVPFGRLGIAAEVANVVAILLREEVRLGTLWENVYP
ncbi:hypothetical protein N7508_010912 [Penicillium antarcticum]|uniref:uncharacterized protein n=1 Tax=Penicillium antarcticum TaxID=416450 RepID=UPI002383197E|nr:uncharacterized protein N7508_010912 [Penicillium antarcticum]KAJ5296091.1 hypothetical protein N7508_010912 [Penicillium antarcticum]